MNNIQLRYAAIPHQILKGKVLEIGARYGNILHSRHKNTILELDQQGQYLGVDIQPNFGTPLTFQQLDLFELHNPSKFDTVLALELIEHIDLRRWPTMFDLLTSLVRPGGFLFLTTPDQESIECFESYWSTAKDGSELHVVYGITSDFIKQFLPSASVWELSNRRPMRDDGESLLRAAGREAKRILTRHPYALRWTKMKGWLAVLWQKEAAS